MMLSEWKKNNEGDYVFVYPSELRIRDILIRIMIWLMDPDPIIFVIDLQDTNTIFF